MATEKNPFDSLAAEIKDLQESLDLPPSEGQVPEGITGLSALRGRFDACIGAVAHEASRFGLVLTSSPLPAEAIVSCCVSLAESLRNLVSAMQCITHTVAQQGVLTAEDVRHCHGRRQGAAEGEDGQEGQAAATFCRAYRAFVYSWLRTASSFVHAGQALVLCGHPSLPWPSPSLSSSSQAAGGGGPAHAARLKKAFLNLSGMMLQHGDQGKARAALPSSPHAAVKRRLLQCAVTAKRSAQELREAHPGSKQGAAEGTASSTAAEASAPSALALPVVDAAVACMRCLATLLKACLEICDAASASPASPGPSPSLPGGPAPSPCLDALAAAAAAAHEACIDLAACANECGEAEAEGEDEDEEEDEGEEGEGTGAGASLTPAQLALAHAQGLAVRQSLPAFSACLARLQREAALLLPLTLPPLPQEAQQGGQGQGVALSAALGEGQAACTACEVAVEAYLSALPLTLPMPQE